MNAARIARLLVLDDRGSQICARQIDVIVPGSWDAARCVWEAQCRLPAKMAMVDDDPALVVWYPLDDDLTFADWRMALPSSGQQPLFDVDA